MRGIVNQPAKADAPSDHDLSRGGARFQEERARKGTDAVNGSSEHPRNWPPRVRRHGQDARVRAQIDSEERLRVRSTVRVSLRAQLASKSSRSTETTLPASAVDHSRRESRTNMESG